MPATNRTTSEPSLWFGAYGGTAAVYFDLPPQLYWIASLTASDWLRFDPSTSTSGRGSALITLKARTNTGPARAANLTVAATNGASLRSYPVTQASAEPLATLNRSVLEVPFPATPRVLELGILGKFAAAQIQKIPEPFNLVALIVVEIAVVALGLLAILVRAAFTEVPEPRTWLGAPPPFDVLATRLPVTVVCISEETYLLAVYILEHAFGE